jgi:DNA-binding NarL/FixJ family response regulator
VIRVVLVDDHRLVRAGPQSLLDASDDIEVVGSAATARRPSSWWPRSSRTWS